MSNSYRKFAEYYDILTENVDYKSRMDEINSLFQKYSDNTDEKILLDLACGTGSMSEEAEKLGYDVIGEKKPSSSNPLPVLTITLPLQISQQKPI